MTIMLLSIFFLLALNTLKFWFIVKRKTRTLGMVFVKICFVTKKHLFVSAKVRDANHFTNAMQIAKTTKKTRCKKTYFYF